MEFIGDSITEGISIDIGYQNYGGNDDMVFWDDSTAGYAWLTAQALNMRPVIMGYGAVGTTRSGAGGVLRACESYPYFSDGYPMESTNADFIVINHDTNDRGAEKEVFKAAYFELLKLVRHRNKYSKIISVTPFSGCLSKEIKEVVEKYNTEFNDDVFYIDSTGWIKPEPIHPSREEHVTVSKNLSRIIKDKLL